LVAYWEDPSRNKAWENLMTSWLLSCEMTCAIAWSILSQ
jgi:hypothetical protein